jgi:hypothetical protein
LRELCIWDPHGSAGSAGLRRWHQPFLNGYPLVMTNSSPWKIPYKWRFLAGKVIYKWAIYTMAMLSGRRVTEESTGNSYVLTKHATTVCRSTADKGRKVQGFTIQRQLNRGIRFAF